MKNFLIAMAPAFRRPVCFNLESFAIMPGLAAPGCQPLGDSARSERIAPPRAGISAIGWYPEERGATVAAHA
jgi:hypothetical protein